MHHRLRIHILAGARPNFVKIAPLYQTLKDDQRFHLSIIHTGQHYAPELSDKIWMDLRLPVPDHSLNVGSGTHAEQVAWVLDKYSKVLENDRPDLVIVVGDVNSTFAACLAAKQLGIQVAHLEAGLRSFDRTMPEEMNRVLTDAISDILWTPSQEANDNLAREGIGLSKVRLVGNIMIDSLVQLSPLIEKNRVLSELELTAGNFSVMTLHRPGNVDEKNTLSKILEVAHRVSKTFPVIFPIHPRTKSRLETFGFMSYFDNRLRAVPAMSYIPFIRLVRDAAFVVTDSGGIQEETSFLGVPCFTLRSNTERPITLTLGTNRLVSLDNLEENVLTRKPSERSHIPLWDGFTALRIRDELVSLL